MKKIDVNPQTLITSTRKNSQGIGRYARELLRERVVDARGKQFGWSYQEILDMIHERFPDAKTTIKSIYTYARDERELGNLDNLYRSTVNLQKVVDESKVIEVPEVKTDE